MAASRSDRLCSMIEADILSLKYKPGDRLDEVSLAERYGTSRTPVREALRRVAAQGLVEIRPHKGAVVTKLGLSDLIELLEVMAELEGACGRLAAKSCLPADLTRIFEAADLCNKCAEAGEIETYQTANKSFHDAIYAASHNKYLIELTLSIRKRVRVYRDMQLANVHRIKSSAEDHERIACAIRDGLAEEADRLLQLHILNIGAEVRQLVTWASAHEQTPSPGTPPSQRGETASAE